MDVKCSFFSSHSLQNSIYPFHIIHNIYITYIEYTYCIYICNVRVQSYCYWSCVYVKVDFIALLMRVSLQNNQGFLFIAVDKYGGCFFAKIYIKNRQKKVNSNRKNTHQHNLSILVFFLFRSELSRSTKKIVNTHFCGDIQIQMAKILQDFIDFFVFLRYKFSFRIFFNIFHILIGSYSIIVLVLFAGMISFPLLFCNIGIILVTDFAN